MGDKILLNSKEIEVIINRFCSQLIENHIYFMITVLIVIHPRVNFFYNKMVENLYKKYGISDINFGVLDITFFRDDFRRSEKPLVANTTDINFIVENKQVVFIDDVLYTGRSIRAALTAIQSFGRPSKIELLVFIDRRFSRHLPIQPDYTGWKVDAINEERVVVHWAENDKEDAVYLIHKK